MRILLGVCGGIAAYKAAALVRRLQDAGHEVRCALTPSAHRFVTPLTLEVLTGHEVYGEAYLDARGRGVEQHVTAAEWAEILVVAPATANLIGRLAHGLAGDFVSTTALVFDGPVFVAPAMHDRMWAKPTVQANVSRLQELGVWFIGPAEGRLASGEIGWGRMSEPETITAVIANRGDLSGRTVVISAGPTFEAIDPVRFLGNRSSGKMGFALAREASARGARTVLVTGPVRLTTPPGVERVDVESAVEMQQALETVAGEADVVVMAAAVSDFRPRETSRQKVKKESGGLQAVALEENPDILAGLAASAPDALRVGFAAETEDLIDNAGRKLMQKDCHVLVANDVSRSDIGFDSEDNEVVVLTRDRDPVRISRRPKAEVAVALWNLLSKMLSRREGQA